MTYLTILIPCLNEADTIESCIKKAQQFINNNDIDAEILVADNGSTDNSKSIALNNKVRVVDVEEKGYGSTLLKGIKKSNGKFVIFADSDDSYDLSKLEPFIQKLKEGYDFVTGNRFKGNIKKGAMPFLHQYFGNPFLSFLGSVLSSILFVISL